MANDHEIIISYFYEEYKRYGYLARYINRTNGRIGESYNKVAVQANIYLDLYKEIHFSKNINDFVNLVSIEDINSTIALVVIGIRKVRLLHNWYNECSYISTQDKVELALTVLLIELYKKRDRISYQIALFEYESVYVT